MKNKIQSYVQLFSGEVELNISVKDNLKPKKDRIFGYFQVSTGTIGAEDCFWDNISYFFDLSYEDFKEEVGRELRWKGFSPKQTYKDIKNLLKRAEKLKLI